MWTHMMDTDINDVEVKQHLLQLVDRSFNVAKRWLADDWAWL